MKEEFISRSESVVELASTKKGAKGDACDREIITDNMVMEEIDDEILQDLYTWVDHVPLSRPKRNMARDFSDGVMCAEVLSHHFPKMVELHNYVPASSTKQKADNWRLLNRKVLRKLNMELSEDVINSLSTAKQYTIERVLLILRSKIDRTIFERQRVQETRLQYSDRPEVDQHTTKQKSEPRTTKQVAKPYQQNHQNEGYSQQAQAQVTTRGPLSRPPSQRSLLPTEKRSPTKAHPPERVTNTQKISSQKSPKQDIKSGPNASVLRGQKLAQKPGLSQSKSPAQPGSISIPVPEHPRTHISAREAKEYTSDYMSRLAYEEKAQECLAKDETIEILNAKVRRLEHLVHLKDIRIEDLQARLEELRPTNKRH